MKVIKKDKWQARDTFPYDPKFPGKISVAIWEPHGCQQWSDVCWTKFVVVAKEKDVILEQTPFVNLRTADLN